MKAVQSSDLAGVDFDGQGTRVIEFHSGGVYECYHVPDSEYGLNASSHGKYFHARIKSRCCDRKISA